ncbi:MAG: class I SAM-dependent methyltransferase [Methylococcaceae bacterium]
MKQLILASLLLCTYTVLNAAENTLLQQAIDGNHRSAEHKNRDQYRHPLATLSFFQLEPTMTVVEIWPGGKGWYTEILAPYLKQNGTFYAANYSANSKIPYFTKNLQKFNDKIKAQPDIYSNIKVTELHPPQQLSIAPKSSADRVLTFRNVHNWMKNGQTKTVFSAMYDALKTGGILGIVEHRAPADTAQDPKAISGYVTEATVISLAEKAGFKLVAKSEINANANDSANHPKGVWTLPPSLRLKQQDREHYLAIGESDRMTLKFIKP